MHPILAYRERFQLYVAAWVLLAAILVVWLAGAAGIPWGNAALLAVPSVLALGFLSPSALYVCRAFPLEERPAPLVAVAALAAGLVTGLAWAAAVRIWAAALDDGRGAALPPERVDEAFPALAALGALVYLLSLAGHYLLITFEAARAAERNALESAVAAREAELKALKSQIQPHFLFNSLNSVSALTAQDPAAARDMAIRLAEFLRTVLAVADRHSIPLRQELSLVENYLAIEKVRLGGRLATTMDVSPEAVDVPILPLTLQPLVENAVKHGIGGLPDGGTVTLRARVRGGMLEITVTNPYDAERGGASGTGSGLDIVRRRLAAAYGRQGTLATTTAAGVHAATVIMPAGERT